MTLGDFLEELAAFRGRFALGTGPTGNWQIRHRRMKDSKRCKACPLTAVYRRKTGRRGHNYALCDMADSLGLRRPTARSIAEAADSSTGHRPDLRRKLLRALNLKEGV
jgi:hypothetical protein